MMLLYHLNIMAYIKSAWIIIMNYINIEWDNYAKKK